MWVSPNSSTLTLFLPMLKILLKFKGHCPQRDSFLPGDPILEFRKLWKTNALSASKLQAARCYDSLLANYTARLRLPTKFSGFKPNAMQFNAKQAHKRQHIYNFFQSTHADAKPSYENTPTMPYRLQPHSS